MTSALQTGIVQLRDVTEKIRISIRNPMKMRNLEAFLLVIAWAIGGGALAIVQLGATGTIDVPGLLWLTPLAALTLVIHIVLRVTAREADPFLLPIATALNGIGIAMITRIDIAEDLTGWDSAGVRQLVWTAIAMVAALVTLLVVRNHRMLGRYRFVAMVVAILLLALPFMPFIGASVNGAQIWVRAFGFSFQPGEIAKIALAVFFAGYLVTARESLSIVGRKVLGMRFPRVRDLGPLLVVWVACLLVLAVQSDLGTALLYFGLFVVMVYVATGRTSWILIGFVLVAIGGFAAYNLLGYVRGRITGWLDAFSTSEYDAPGGSYQVVQGIFGMSQGGMTGTGLGRGSPDIVPLAESDFIIASLGEELGLIGLFAIFAMYLLFVSRGFRIGHHGPDDFTKLLGVGLAFTIGLQIFIVAGGVLRVIPLTGLTAPFLAAGGSSLVANWIICALLLRMSDSVRPERKVVVP